MLKGLLDCAWRVVVCGFTFAASLVFSRIAFQLASVSPPRMLTQAPEHVAGYYLLAGSIAVAAGMLFTVLGIKGALPIRWLALTIFLFIGFGVSTTIESSIFSTTEGVLWMIPILFLPCASLAGVAVVLINPPEAQQLIESPTGNVLRRWTLGQWAWRSTAAILAFPLVYFTFGIIVSPIVSAYYEQGVAGLALPTPSLIAATQLLRGLLHFMAVLPILYLWNASEKRLVFALTLAFFVFVMAYDFVLAYQVPVELVVVHSFEVLIDSLIYAWLLVTFLTGKKLSLWRSKAHAR